MLDNAKRHFARRTSSRFSNATPNASRNGALVAMASGNAKIRTKWYLVNISLFASDLIPDGYKSGKISSDLRRIGSAGRGQHRTFWDFSLVLGIPSSRWGARPYIIRPFPFPHDVYSTLLPEPRDQSDRKKTAIHTFHQALLWRQQIRSDAQLTQAKIAAREGISRARVTQVMNLLQLSTQIQEELQSPPAPLEIHSFSERCLRKLLACDEEGPRLLRWRALVQELQSSASR